VSERLHIRQAKERDKAAEECNQAAEERHQAAEARNQAAEERMGRFEQEMSESSPSLAAADDFAVKVATFFDFYPEYRGRRLLPVLGRWGIPDPVVERLTAHRIYALRMGEETMELVNALALEALAA